jgi:hypothetical protein
MLCEIVRWFNEAEQMLKTKAEAHGGKLRGRGFPSLGIALRPESRKVNPVKQPDVFPAVIMPNTPIPEVL